MHSFPSRVVSALLGALVLLIAASVPRSNALNTTEISCCERGICRPQNCNDDSTLKSRSFTSKFNACFLYKDILNFLQRTSRNEAAAVQQYCSAYNQVTTTTTPIYFATSTAPTQIITTITSTTSTLSATTITTATVTNTFSTATTSTSTLTETSTTTALSESITPYSSSTTTYISYSSSVPYSSPASTQMRRRAAPRVLQRPPCLAPLAASAISQACSCIITAPSTLTKTAATKTITSATVTPSTKTTSTTTVDVTSTTTSTALTTTEITVTMTISAQATATATSIDYVEFCTGTTGCTNGEGIIALGVAPSALDCYNQCVATPQCVAFQYGDQDRYCNLLSLPTSQARSDNDSDFCKNFSLIDLANCHP